MQDNIWKSLDWTTIVIYLLLITFGWFSICGASYDFAEGHLLDFSTRAGKQFVWIICSFGLSFALLMLDHRFYDTFSWPLYLGMILLLLITIGIAPDTKGSRSWLVLGPISLQPAEFAKFATALILAKVMGSYGFILTTARNAALVGILILLPMGLIIMQKETGSALVYLSFFLMLYREGMPGIILLSAVCAVLYFVVGIRFGEEYMADGITPIGPYAVLLLILFFAAIMTGNYGRRTRHALVMLGGTFAIALLSYLIDTHLVAFNQLYTLWALCAITFIYLLWLWISQRKVAYLLIGLFAIASIGFLYSSEYIFNKVLQPHQRIRIEVLLGMEEDLKGAGYNVNQSKIAIGSGGLFGKGFLNGTQTKLKYVPEQDTDFIFCTVGEEEGFVGSAAVLLLFLILIWRLIYLSERQTSTFGRVYGYSVLSIFLFHLFINVGMVLGLTPVIGIPLPFFSYGGSSLWGFTILLFIFLRIDAGRARRLA